MPFMKNGKRDYKKEVAKYTSKPSVIKKRSQQNAARQEMMKRGLAHKGDGKDVDHKTPISKGGSNSPSNLRVVPASSNRSFERNKDSSVKSQTSKKERKKK
jgi:hypothetical protein